VRFLIKIINKGVFQVRAAWFSNLISLCQHAFFLLEDKYKNAVESVFNDLDESDPTVLPVVWEATLHVLVVIKVNIT
jgi:hypothetical protein